MQNNVKHNAMKKLLILTAVMLSMTVQAKTTYIPTYRSFIKIWELKGDSVMAEGIQDELELMAQDGSFSVTLVHESVDKDKVKEIKRAKAAAGWMTFAAVMAGAAAGFNAGYTNNALTTYIGMRSAENIAVLAGFMNDMAKEGERLKIDFFIDNFTEEELVVGDLARGLTWYILPHTSMQFSLENPGIERLRICHPDQASVKYVDIIGGNYATKETIVWEDVNCWIVKKTGDEIVDDYGRPSEEYYFVKKGTFEMEKMSEKEVKEFKKEHKGMQE